MEIDDIIIKFGAENESENEEWIPQHDCPVTKLPVKQTLRG